MVNPRIPHNDALLRDMIADAQRYSDKVIRRRANGIRRMEPPDILAFYDDQLMDTAWRINMLKAGRQRKNR